MGSRLRKRGAAAGCGRHAERLKETCRPVYAAYTTSRASLMKKLKRGGSAFEREELKRYVEDEIRLLERVDPDALRRAYDLRPLHDLRDYLAGADLTLVVDSERLFPPVDLPQNVRYIGPVLWEPDVPDPGWLPAVTSRWPSKKRWAECWSNRVTGRMPLSSRLNREKTGRAGWRLNTSGNST